MDERGRSNIQHMDGQEPSGFITSTYRGMIWSPPPPENNGGDGGNTDGGNTDGENTDGEDTDETIDPAIDIEKAQSIDDIIAVATADGSFDFEAFIDICYTNILVCFNPVKWISFFVKNMFAV